MIPGLQFQGNIKNPISETGVGDVLVYSKARVSGTGAGRWLGVGQSWYDVDCARRDLVVLRRRTVDRGTER